MKTSIVMHRHVFCIKPQFIPPRICIARKTCGDYFIPARDYGDANIVSLSHFNPVKAFVILMSSFPAPVCANVRVCCNIRAQSVIGCQIVRRCASTEGPTDATNFNESSGQASLEMYGSAGGPFLSDGLRSWSVLASVVLPVLVVFLFLYVVQVKQRLNAFSTMSLR